MVFGCRFAKRSSTQEMNNNLSLCNLTVPCCSLDRDNHVFANNSVGRHVRLNRVEHLSPSLGQTNVFPAPFRSNMCPENSTANNHDFQMTCFEDTTSCKACSMLLRYVCSDEGEPPAAGEAESVHVSPAEGPSSRATAAVAVRWPHIKSVWAESLPVDGTQVCAR